MLLISRYYYTQEQMRNTSEMPKYSQKCKEHSIMENTGTIYIQVTREFKRKFHTYDFENKFTHYSES